MDVKVSSSFTLRDPTTDASDLVLISPSVWKSLRPSTGPGESADGRIYVSVQPSYPTPHSSQKLGSICCWASEDAQTAGITIPSTWHKTYKHILRATDESGAGTVTISRLKPVILSEVIVTAASDEAYEWASSHNSLLEEALCREKVVLHQGDAVVVDSHRFRLVMLQPVLQGIAQERQTEFLLVRPDTSSHEDSADTVSLAGTDEEGIEIGEEFLADDPLDMSSPTLNGINGDSSYPYSDPSHPTFKPEPLSFQFPAFTNDFSVGIRTCDLSRIGVCSGDWVIVSSPSDPLKQRLAHVVASDEYVHSSSIVTAPPTVLYNICSKVTEDLTLRHIALPTIPTAKSITIARIASPFSTDKKYQPLFLKGLKEYFAERKRLVKLGDIIGVPIDTDGAAAAARLAEGDDGDDLDEGYLDSSRANQTVYFLVTNLQHDPLSLPEQDAAAAGELGCWVNSSQTQMVQTGVEHSFVPNQGTYMGSDTQSPQALFAQLTALTTPSHLLGPSSPFELLHSYVSAALTSQAASYSLAMTVLLKGARGSGKFTLVSWIAHVLGLHIVEVDCYDIIDDSDVKTEANLRVRFDKAAECSPSILVLMHLEALVQTTQPKPDVEGTDSRLGNVISECLEQLQANWKMSGYPTVVVGTTSDSDKTPKSILSSFKHEISIEAPSEKVRYEMLFTLLGRYTLAPDSSLSYLATQTAALVASDLVHLVHQAHFASVTRAVKATGLAQHDLVQAGISLTAEDFELALGRARASYSESVGAPKIPNVTWDDVGGLAHVKADILDTIQLPLEHPELFADGLKQRSGVLLYGPPGTGKTLLAKAVATSCSLNFFSVKGPELLNMYIGESEANVRRVFQRARDAKPCVIFFDELDSVAPKRGNQGDSGGVMDRIVSQLLAELDGMSSGGDGGAEIFVMGATNRPDLLDPALLRPGRFDRMLYLGVSDTHKAQQDIIEALTRKFRLDPNLSLQELSERCPFNYTGADFYALCSDAMLNAMTRKAEETDAVIAEINASPPVPNPHPHPMTPQYYLAEIATKEEMQVLVSKADFDRALANLVPSVSEAEMDRYGQIQKKFSSDRSAVDTT